MRNKRCLADAAPASVVPLMSSRCRCIPRCVTSASVLSSLPHSSPPTLRRSAHNNHRHIASTEAEASASTTMPTLPTLLQRFYPPSHTVSQEYVDQTTHPTSPVINSTLLQPSSVYQPRDKHDRKGSPDRSSRPEASVRLLRMRGPFAAMLLLYCCVNHLISHSDLYSHAHPPFISVEYISP